MAGSRTVHDGRQAYVFLLPAGDINTALVLNPNTRLQRFHYPVHLKPAKQIRTDDKGDYFLALFRKPDNGEGLHAALTRAGDPAELLQEGPGKAWTPW